MYENEVMQGRYGFILGGNSNFMLVQDPNTRVEYHLKLAKGREVKTIEDGLYYVSCSRVNNVHERLMYIGWIKYVRNQGNWVFTWAGKSDYATGVLTKNYTDSVNGLMFILTRLVVGAPISSKLHILHFGKCCVCGRKLMDTESVIRGVGPTCFKKMNLIANMFRR